MLETVHLKKIFERVCPPPSLRLQYNCFSLRFAARYSNWVRADKGFRPGLTGAQWSLLGLHAEDEIRRNARSVTEGSARWEGGKRKVKTPLFLSFHRSWYSPAHLSATKKSFKMWLGCFKLYRRLFHLDQFVKCWQIFRELHSKRLYRRSEKEKESRCLVFKISTKREI